MKMGRIMICVAVFTVFPLAAQDSTGHEDTELESKPVEQICNKVDWEETPEIDEKKSFFDLVEFECEEDWVDAETHYAPLLKKLGEPSFRPLVDKPQAGKKSAPMLRIRKMHKFDGEGHRMFSMNCQFASDKTDAFSWDYKPTGGTAVLDYDNWYIKPSRLRRTMKLGAADCGFFTDLIQNASPYLIEQRPMVDQNGPIILHAGSSIFELIDTDGDYIVFIRGGHQTYIAEDESDSAEAELNRMLSYFEERTKEMGRR